MPKKKPLVVVTRKLPDVIETRMMELFDVRLNVDDHPMSADELVEMVNTAEVLVPTVTDAIDGKLIAAAGNQLKLIANYGTGVDHIDLAAARKKNIIVTNTPDVLTEDTADMTMALILAVPRRLVEGERVMRKGNWTGWAPTWMLGRRISGKRLGIIGMGRIGQAVARRARGFGLSIHYHNRNRVHGDIEHEPAVNPKLLALDNVVLLPHMSSATFEGRIAMGEKVLVNIKTFVDEHTPPDRVLVEAF